MFVLLNQTVARTVVGTVGTAVCAAICLFGATAPAHAGTPDEAPSRVVHYADLNLSSDAGRATLDRRIRTAARAVCSTGGNTLADRARTIRCTREAIDGALPKVAAARAAARAG